MEIDLHFYDDWPTIFVYSKASRRHHCIAQVMNPVRASFNWLKFTWATQPVLFLSCVLGGLGEDRQVCGCVLSRIM